MSSAEMGKTELGKGQVEGEVSIPAGHRRFAKPMMILWVENPSR